MSGPWKIILHEIKIIKNKMQLIKNFNLKAHEINKHLIKKLFRQVS